MQDFRLYLFPPQVCPHCGEPLKVSFAARNLLRWSAMAGALLLVYERQRLPWPPWVSLMGVLLLALVVNIVPVHYKRRGRRRGRVR